MSGGPNTPGSAQNFFTNALGEWTGYDLLFGTKGDSSTSLTGSQGAGAGLGNAAAGAVGTGPGSALGGLDGSTSAQAALDQSQLQFNIAQAQAAQLVTQNQANDQNAQITASNNAASATLTAQAVQGPTPYTSTPLGLGPEGTALPGSNNKDFLGL